MLELLNVLFKYCIRFRGGKFFFLSGNLGRRLEIFCKIYNVTITKIRTQMHNYCIICTLVIVCSYIAIVVCYVPQLWVRRKKTPCGSGFRPTLLQIAQQKTAKTMKKIFKKKIYFRPTVPNFFTLWNRNHRYFFYALWPTSKDLTLN
jgi:hypothetical protein